MPGRSKKLFMREKHIKIELVSATYVVKEFYHCKICPKPDILNAKVIYIKMGLLMKLQ